MYMDNGAEVYSRTPAFIAMIQKIEHVTGLGN
jgi:hypothetical protein